MPDQPATHHDHSYKRLFSHREMVRDLLVQFVREDWVQQVDLDTLETVKGSFVTDDFASAKTTSSGVCAGTTVGSTSIC